MERSDILDAIERREGQLWLLAFFLIFLLAVSLFLVDFAVPSFLQGNFLRPVGDALSSNLLRALFLVAVVLICAYFREKVRALRAANRDLMLSLSLNQSSLAAKSRQLDHWHELGHALITTSDLQRLLELIVDTALEVTGGESGSLMLLDPTGEELEVVAARGTNAEARRNVRLRSGEGIAGYVVHSGRPLLLRDGEVSKELEGLLLRRQEIGSAICVPLVLGDRAVGTLSVNRKPTLGDFQPDDLETLAAFANQAVLAIDKAQIYAEYQEHVGRLRGMLEQLEQTQAQLLQSEKLASIGLLAGGVAHEINNPLTVILGRTELLMEDLADSPSHKDLEVIREQTRRIAEIVHGLLTFSRDNNQRSFQPTDVNLAIEQTFRLTEKILDVDNITVRRDLAEGLPRVLGNQGQLQQVFTNLVINAYQAMPQGGLLTVKSWEEQGMVKVSFTDSGIGIPPERLPFIFDPFFTTKPEGHGTGLGLAVSYGIAQSHGGDLTASSEPGKGTVMVMELPALV